MSPVCSRPSPLERDGHRVTVLESDPSPLPDTPDDAFGRWDRRGSPQTRHSHAFLARLHNLLAERAPELLDFLLANGAERMRFADLASQVIPVPRFVPDDEAITMLRAAVSRSSGRFAASSPLVPASCSGTARARWVCARNRSRLRCRRVCPVCASLAARRSPPISSSLPVGVARKRRNGSRRWERALRASNASRAGSSTRPASTACATLRRLRRSTGRWAPISAT